MGHLANEDMFFQLEEHLKCSEQNWLMGAGISFDANLPLMYPLTNKVKNDLSKTHSKLYNDIVEPLFNELSEQCHIEHVLSHLGDYAALAERSKNKKVFIKGIETLLSDLESVHSAVLDL